MKFLKEDPDQTFSPSSNEEISWVDNNARAFGFLNLSKKQTISNYVEEGEANKIGTLEGFGQEWQNRLCISEPGDSHATMVYHLLPEIWKSSEGIMTFYKSSIDPSTGILTFNYKDEPIVLDLSTFNDEDKKMLYPTVKNFFSHVNVRPLLFPSGRIWPNHKVVSFWVNEGEVTPEHLTQLFKGMKIPEGQIREYYIEFLGDDSPHQKVTDYIIKSTGKKVYTKEEEEERKKRAAAAMAKVHVAGAAGTKDKDVKELLAKRKENLVKADAEARMTGKIPDLKTRQQAMTSESLLSFKDFFKRK